MSCQLIRLQERPPQRLRLPSMDQFSIIDKNKGTCCVETQNKYCFKYLALFSIRKPNFPYVTHRQLFEKKLLNLTAGPFIALGCPESTTQFSSMDHMQVYTSSYVLHFVNSSFTQIEELAIYGVSQEERT